MARAAFRCARPRHRRDFKVPTGSFIASAMSQMPCRLSLYCGVWISRKSAITCEQQVPNLIGLAVRACASRQILA